MDREAIGNGDVITLRGKEVPTSTRYVDQWELRFYPENPRIYSHLWGQEGSPPTQHQILEVLAGMPHVRETLVPSIKANGGLIEPLLVRDGMVLEGNSRLAAYRILSELDADRWRLVRARSLPDDISDADVFSLLGEYHIVGKKDWLPFEQAGYLYRQHRQHDVSERDLSRRIGLTPGKVRHLIATYRYMIEVEDRTPTRWSFYDELLKGRRFDKATRAYPQFRDVIVEKIRSGEIERAVDLRDRLPLIVEAGGNTLRRFVTGSLSFEEAVSDSRLRGAGDYNMRKLNEFRQWLADAALDGEFREAPPEEKKRLKFELERIERRLGQLARNMMSPSS